MSDEETLPYGWRRTSIGEETEEGKERVGVGDPPIVLSSTKHRGLIPSDEFFRNRTVYSHDLSNYKTVLKDWFAYATNHLAEGSIGLQNSFPRACVSPIYTVFSCREGVDPNYLYRVLKSPELTSKYKLHEQASVDRRGAVRYRDFGKISLNLPPLEEQQRIAEILDTADEAIRSTERLISKLERAKQGLLHDLLTRGADSSGRLRADYAREPRLYRDSRLGRIPVNWTVHLLDEVSVRGSGHTPNKDIPAYWDGGIKWVSLADSAKLDKIYITETDKEISDLGIANSSAVKHRAGTVILSRDAGVGKSAILGHEMAVSQHFIAWACGELLDYHYLYYWLQFMKPRFEAIAMGSTIKTIGLPFFRKLSIPLPHIDQQKAAVAQLLAADADIVRHHIEVRKQRLLRQGLVGDLLTGRVRVGAWA